eukprot:m51a1_g3539 putative calcium calmodulin-dependent protein kinase type ii subunit delta isoform x9 (818) ;mRNA; f:976207-980787
MHRCTAPLTLQASEWKSGGPVPSESLANALGRGGSEWVSVMAADRVVVLSARFRETSRIAATYYDVRDVAVVDAGSSDPDEVVAAVCGSDGVDVFSLRHGSQWPASAMRLHEGESITLVEFSPDAGFLAVARTDGSFALWDTSTWAMVDLGGEMEMPTSLFFGEDLALVGATWGGAVIAWREDQADDGSDSQPARTWLRRATRLSDGSEVALKIVAKRTPYEQNWEQRAWSRLDHPHIVRLYDALETRTHFYMAMELVRGGDLLDRISRDVSYCEFRARHVIAQVLEAVAHMHAQGVIHRDLKLENLLLADESDDAAVKIADFDLSVLETDAAELTDMTGTPGYVAPEVLACEDDCKAPPYTKSCDLWSVGVILHVLLCGAPPFLMDPSSDLWKLDTRRGRLSFSEPAWKSITPEAIDLVKCLLARDPAKRITAQEALGHPWLQRKDLTKAPQLGDTLEGLKRLRARRKLKAALRSVLAVQVLRSQVSMLTRIASSGELDLSFMHSKKQESKPAPSANALSPREDSVSPRGPSTLVSPRDEGTPSESLAGPAGVPNDTQHRRSKTEDAMPPAPVPSTPGPGVSPEGIPSIKISHSHHHKHHEGDDEQRQSRSVSCGATSAPMPLGSVAGTCKAADTQKPKERKSSRHHHASPDPEGLSAHRKSRSVAAGLAAADAVKPALQADDDSVRRRSQSALVPYTIDGIDLASLAATQGTCGEGLLSLCQFCREIDREVEQLSLIPPAGLSGKKLEKWEKAERKRIAKEAKELAKQLAKEQKQLEKEKRCKEAVRRPKRSRTVVVEDLDFDLAGPLTGALEKL